jgi:hypothetical protein
MATGCATRCHAPRLTETSTGLLNTMKPTFCTSTPTKPPSKRTSPFEIIRCLSRSRYRSIQWDRMKARTRSIYEINLLFKGYLHVVYNGSLYYHQQEESRVIRYELASERNTMVYLPNATVTGNVHLYAHVRISSFTEWNDLLLYNKPSFKNSIFLTIHHSRKATWISPWTKRAYGWFTARVTVNNPPTTPQLPSSILIP